MIEKDQSLQQLIETTKQQIKQTYSICFFNLIWIVVQNLFVGIYWKSENSFNYPSPVIMILNSITPILLILGCYFTINHFLVLVLLLCIMTILLAGISIICTIIILPQMHSFHSNCLMGFSIEDCRIYDISYMWPILFIQFLLCTIVLIIKIIMIKRAYRLYILFHEFRSPFLLYLQEKTRIKIELPRKSCLLQESND